MLALVLTLFISFVVGAVVAVLCVVNLLVAPLQRSVNALEERVDKLGEERKTPPPASKRDTMPDDEDKRRTLLPQGPDDVPLFGFAARPPSDTLPSATV